MMSMFLLFAGHETTVTAIGTGTLLLLARPAQWRALAGDPALVPATVEEMLRAGDLVLLDNGAANHDQAVFIDPERSAPFHAARSITLGIYPLGV